MTKQDDILAGMKTDEGRAALTALLAGKLDDDLLLIERNAAARRKWLVKNTWRIGMRVRLVGTKNPELEGKLGTIVKQNPTRLSVFLDSDYDESWMGPLEKLTIAEKRDYASLGVPPSMLEKA